MQEKREEKPKVDYIILLVLFFILVAIIVSFIRYYIRLDYNIYLHTECDPTVEVCTTDSDTNYNKFIVKASELQKFCGDKQDDACILDLYAKGLAEKLNCEENLSDSESCTEIEGIIASDIESAKQ
ncbi:MAG: hypothetical protein WC631_00650 [Candidatus Paceibacterota bacterium]|jgi:hypothetical protein